MATCQISEFRNFVDSTVRSGFQFLSVRELVSKPKLDGKRFFLLKHDVHSHIRKAVRLAKIEWVLGIQATFFAYPSETLKLTKSESLEYYKSLNEIQDLGHEVGVHLDLLKISSKNVNVSKIVSEEINLFKKNGIRVVSASRHGASEFPLNLRNTDWMFDSTDPTFSLREDDETLVTADLYTQDANVNSQNPGRLHKNFMDDIRADHDFKRFVTSWEVFLKNSQLQQVFDCTVRTRERQILFENYVSDGGSEFNFFHEHSSFYSVSSVPKISDQELLFKGLTGMLLHPSNVTF